MSLFSDWRRVFRLKFWKYSADTSVSGSNSEGIFSSMLIDLGSAVDFEL